jgi:hypothetical protein
MKEERIKGEGVQKERKEKEKGSGDERSKKKSKIGGKKIKNKGPKNLNVGEGRKNQKKGFHQMASKFAHISQICLAPFDGNPSITTISNCHHWMANKMDLIHAINFHYRPLDGNQKGRIMTNPLVSVPHKDGRLQKNMVAIQPS